VPDLQVCYRALRARRPTPTITSINGFDLHASMTRRLTILHVTAPSRVGGLEKVVSALTTGHAQAGHAVHVAAVAGSDEDAQHFLAPLGSRGIHTAPIIVSSRSYLRERRMIRDLCRTIDPDVVHTHGYRSDVIASSVARRLGIPVVTTAHGFTYGGWRNRLYEALQVRAFRSFAAVVAVSQSLVELLAQAGVSRDRLHLIVNAWSTYRPLEERDVARAKLGLSAGARYVAWVGRLSPEKGADVLLEAIPHLTTDATICFIGDGPERSVLEARAATLGISERVRWCGVVEHAGALLRAFDAFALSSRTEGTPIALFEAMSAALPIVATQVGGVPSVLGEPGVAALTVESENPQALAGAIDAVLRDPSAAARRSEAATRALTERFSVGPWLEAYENLYRRVSRR
jgi:glycosyltransferase involved in cell wall biosynthesis